MRLIFHPKQKRQKMSDVVLEGEICRIPANPSVTGDQGMIGVIPNPNFRLPDGTVGDVKTVRDGIEDIQSKELIQAGYKVNRPSSPPREDQYQEAIGLLKKAFMRAIKSEGGLTNCPDSSRGGPTVPLNDFRNYVIKPDIPAPGR